MCKVYTRKRQTKTGCSWEWRFEMPRTGGKRKQLSKSGYRSESEALAAGYAEFNRISTEGAVSESSITMNELLAEYVEQILLPGLSKGTANNYRAIIANHISPDLGTSNWLRLPRVRFSTCIIPSDFKASLSFRWMASGVFSLELSNMQKSRVTYPQTRWMD